MATIPPSSSSLPGGQQINPARGPLDSVSDETISLEEFQGLSEEEQSAEIHRLRSPMMDEGQKAVNAPFPLDETEKTVLESDPCILRIKKNIQEEQRLTQSGSAVDPFHSNVEVEVVRSRDSDSDGNVQIKIGSPPSGEDNTQVVIQSIGDSNHSDSTGASFDLEKTHPSMELEPAGNDASMDVQKVDDPNNISDDGNKIWLSENTWVRYNNEDHSWSLETVLQHPGIPWDCKRDDEGNITGYNKNPRKVHMTIQMQKGDSKELGGKGCVGMILKLKSFHNIYKSPKAWINALADNQSYGIYVGGGGTFRIFEVGVTDLSEKSSNLLGGQFRDLCGGKDWNATLLEGAHQGNFEYTFRPNKMIQDHLLPSGLNLIKRKAQNDFCKSLEEIFKQEINQIHDKNILEYALGKASSEADQKQRDDVKKGLEDLSGKKIETLQNEVSSSSDPRKAILDKDTKSAFMRPIHHFTNERNNKVMDRMMFLINNGLQNQAQTQQPPKDNSEQKPDGETPSLTTENADDSPPPPSRLDDDKIWP
ncbi:MAG: hypothetical protein ACI9S8_000959 [Chlamydiales bacterium]|jgi:hypothetical protein